MEDRRLGHARDGAQPRTDASGAAAERSAPSHPFSTGRRPPTVARAQAKADAAIAFGEALRDEGVSQVEIAAATGAGRAVVQRWADPNDVASVTLGDLVTIGASYRGVAKRLLTWAADRLGLVVSERLEAEQPADHFAQIARMGREHAEAVGAYIEGLADGKLDDVELERIDRELSDAEEANAALRAWVETEKRARASAKPLRSVGGR